MEPTAQPILSPLKRNALIVLGIIFVLLAAIFTLNYFKIINLGKFSATKPPQSASIPQTSPEPTIKESQSPVAFSILQNPIVYQWRGSVEGAVVAKSADSITLSDTKGHNITIPIDINPATKTPFFTQKNGKFIDISFDDVIIGNILRGDFFVAVEDKNKISGSSFFVEQ